MVYREIGPAEIIGSFASERFTQSTGLSALATDLLGAHWAEEFIARCEDSSREWRCQTSLAWSVLTIEPEMYRRSRASERLIADGIRDTSTARALGSAYARCSERFRSGSSPASKIVAVPEDNVRTFSSSMSTQVTRKPVSAKQVPVTSPT